MAGPYNPTTYVFLQGKAKWAKLVTPDTKFGSQWSVQLYPNDESYQKILDLKENKGEVSGVLNVVKKDEDGYNISLKRQTQRLIKGKMVGFTPPVILEADGTSPLRNALIGNGSDITCKVQLYRYKKPAGGFGQAIRLESVRVDNLIPYESKRDFDEDEQRQTKGIDGQPAQLF